MHYATFFLIAYFVGMGMLLANSRGAAGRALALLCGGVHVVGYLAITYYYMFTPWLYLFCGVGLFIQIILLRAASDPEKRPPDNAGILMLYIAFCAVASILAMITNYIILALK